MGTEWGVRKGQVEVGVNKIMEDLEKAAKDLKKETDLKKIEQLKYKV